MSEEQQLERLGRLEEELQAAERRRKEAMKRKEALQKRLDEVIEKIAVNIRAVDGTERSFMNGSR